MGFPGGSEVKVPVCNVRDLGVIPGSERFPGEGNGNPLQYSCLQNPMDRGAWWATVHGVAKSQTQLERLHYHFQRSNGLKVLRVCLDVHCTEPSVHRLWENEEPTQERAARQWGPQERIRFPVA